MKKTFFAAILMTLPFAMQAQLGKNLLNKAKYKVQQRADAKVDKAMDKTLDAAENSVNGKGDANAGTTAEAPGTDNDNTTVAANEAPKEEKPTGIKSYSKFDFV